MKDWAEIRRLYQSGKLSQAAIARQLSMSRNTVSRALQTDGPPQYVRAPVTASAWARIEPSVRVMLKQFPAMPATVTAERVGWPGGIPGSPKP